MSAQCALDDCEEPARARICYVSTTIGTQYQPVSVIARPLTDGDPRGKPYCLDHAHFWLDWLLMDAQAPQSAGQP